MKIRSGFVSNSSSSSFVCDLCSETESAWETPEEWVYCKNDHWLCYECAPEIPEKNEDVDDDEDSDYSLPSLLCPFCTFQALRDRDMKRYLQKKYQINEDLVFTEVKKANKRRRVLRDYEYNTYVCRQENLTGEQILEEIKSKFSDYDSFLYYCRS
jgi:hypothetical protein